MEDSRVTNIHLDNSGPLLIWAEELSHEIKKGAVVYTSFCDNPSCKDVHVTAFYIDEQVDEISFKKDEVSDSFFAYDKERDFKPLPRSSFSVNVDTHGVKINKNPDDGPVDPELLAWLTDEIVSEENLNLLKRRWRMAKGVGDDVDQWRNQDWSWWKPGEKICYYDAFPDSSYLIVELDEQKILVSDYYCVTPGCECQDIHIHIASLGESSTRSGGTIVIDRRTLNPISIEPDTIDRNALQDIWKEFSRVYKLKPLLQQRRKRMQEVGKGLFEMNDINPGGMTVENVQKIGRNDPCPCGSGKKYKKCCLK